MDIAFILSIVLGSASAIGTAVMLFTGKFLTRSNRIKTRQESPVNYWITVAATAFLAVASFVNVGLTLAKIV